MIGKQSSGHESEVATEPIRAKSVQRGADREDDGGADREKSPLLGRPTSGDYTILSKISESESV